MPTARGGWLAVMLAVMLFLTTMAVTTTATRVPRQPPPALRRHLYRHHILSKHELQLQPPSTRHERASEWPFDVTTAAPYTLMLDAYGRKLTLDFHVDQRLLSDAPSVRILLNGTLHQLALDHENYFRGSVRGVPGSQATLYRRRDGNVLATIVLPTETLYIEPARPHYAPAADDAEEGPVDMILYSSRDMVPGSWHGGNSKRSAEEGDNTQHASEFCRGRVYDPAVDAPTETRRRRFFRLQDSLVASSDVHDIHNYGYLLNSWSSQDPTSAAEAADTMALYPDADCDGDCNTNTTTTTLPDTHPSRIHAPLRGAPTRHRRAQASSTYNTCLMTLVADYRFYLYHGLSAADSVAAMMQHITEADRIFRRTSFGGQQGLGLGVHSVIILGTEASDPFSQSSSWTAETMLQNFANEFDFTSSCLAHLFTHYDFADGTLGLAWVGSPDAGRAGGLCYHHALQSLNAGISTNVNFGNDVPFATSALVVTHEVGHNWGAEHDSPSDPVCSPDVSSGGRYVMFAMAVDGNSANNDAFSPCSTASIAAVVQAKGNCFAVPSAAICGNRIVEPAGPDDDINTLADNEECDAGGDTTCCSSSCKFKGSATCEPNNNLCCNPNTCQGYQRSDNVVCFQAFDYDKFCRDTGFCTLDGSDPICETPLPAKADDTVCGNGGRCVEPAVPDTDYASRCTSFCARFGALPCTCETNADACRTCCRDDPSVTTCDASNCDCPFRRFTTNGTCVPAASVLTTANMMADGPACYRDNEADPDTEFDLNPTLDPTCVASATTTCQRILNVLAGDRCYKGACNLAGECVAVSTGVARDWGSIGDLSVDDIAEWAKHNIVGAVMVVMLVLWVPCGLCIAGYDRRMRARDPNYGVLRGDDALRYRGRRSGSRRGSRHGSRAHSHGPSSARGGGGGGGGVPVAGPVSSHNGSRAPQQPGQVQAQAGAVTVSSPNDMERFRRVKNPTTTTITATGSPATGSPDKRTVQVALVEARIAIPKQHRGGNQQQQQQQAQQQRVIVGSGSASGSPVRATVPAAATVVSPATNAVIVSERRPRRDTSSSAGGEERHFDGIVLPAAVSAAATAATKSQRHDSPARSSGRAVDAAVRASPPGSPNSNGRRRGHRGTPKSSLTKEQLRAHQRQKQAEDSRNTANWAATVSEQALAPVPPPMSFDPAPPYLAPGIGLPPPPPPLMPAPTPMTVVTPSAPPAEPNLYQEPVNPYQEPMPLVASSNGSMGDPGLNASSPHLPAALALEEARSNANAGESAPMRRQDSVLSGGQVAFV